jgi:RimJ/RimL family protein N-acetyltransferase
MASNDLQIGDTLTHDSHRGRGLAKFALNSILQKMAQPGRKFWYICDENNTASSRVALKGGFRLIGKGIRTKRIGISLLGSFKITEPIN